MSIAHSTPDHYGFFLDLQLSPVAPNGPAR
jgi:hypothetical protein